MEYVYKSLDLKSSFLYQVNTSVKTSITCPTERRGKQKANSSGKSKLEEDRSNSRLQVKTTS